MANSLMANSLIVLNPSVDGHCLLCLNPKCLEDERFKALLTELEEEKNLLEKEETLVETKKHGKKPSGREILASSYRHDCGEVKFSFGKSEKLEFLCTVAPEEFEDFRVKFCQQSRPP